MIVNRYLEIIDAFELKLNRLISEHQSLQKQYEELQNNLGNKQEDLMLAHKEVLELRTQNSHLSLASQMSGSIEKRLDAKKQIDKLVREIDKCIALLNE